MPHQCTECGRTFPDGSKEMLSGCPDCGGNKFQFKPSDAVDVAAGGAGSADGAGGGTGGGVGGGQAGDDGGAMSRAKATVRDLMGRGGDDAASSAAGDAPSATDNAPSATDVATASEASPGATDGSASATDESHAGRSSASGDAGASPGTVDDDGDHVTPSGSGEWPKSATEEYDTPAEKARRRESTSARAESPADSSLEESRGDATVEESADGAASTDGAAAADASADGAAAADASASESEDGSISAQMGETEDDAQRSARSDVVSPDELPSRESAASGGVSDEAAGDGPSERPAAAERADRPPSNGAADVRDRPSAGDVASEPDEESPDLDELREELNSQFESIKVLDPGKYELNLMELYDREEYIISLQEDGRYVIEVPESWRGEASPD